MCQILLPTWVSWAVVSSFNRLQAHTYKHTHNHVAAKWQQTHIYILFKGRIYIYISHISFIYIYVYAKAIIFANIHIYCVCLCVAETFRTWGTFCTSFVQGVMTVVSCFSLFCTLKEVLSRCCQGFEDSALGYFMIFFCLCNNSCTRV